MKCAACNSFIYEAWEHCLVCRARQDQPLDKLSMSLIEREAFDGWYEIMIGPFFNMPSKEAERKALSLTRECSKIEGNKLLGLGIGDERQRN